MNGIYLQCILDFLKDNDFEYEHLDNMGIAIAVYYFPNNITEVFDTNSCISNSRTIRILTKFGLQNQIQEIQKTDCLCN